MAAWRGTKPHEETWPCTHAAPTYYPSRLQRAWHHASFIRVQECHYAKCVCVPVSDVWSVWNVLLTFVFTLTKKEINKLEALQSSTFISSMRLVSLFQRVILHDWQRSSPVLIQLTPFHLVHLAYNNQHRGFHCSHTLKQALPRSLPSVLSPGLDVKLATSTILTANCCPVSLLMQRLTTLKGPLQKHTP